MARYKPVEYAQGQFIPISFEQQILPGTFEHALSFIVDNKLDFTTIDAARTNDASGAPAYDPRVMLKIVLCAYARGMISSREIEAYCQKNVVMMALSAGGRRAAICSALKPPQDLPCMPTAPVHQGCFAIHPRSVTF